MAQFSVKIMRLNGSVLGEKQQHIRLQLGTETVTAVLRTRTEVRAGEEVAINFDTENAHLFDCNTELRLKPTSVISGHRATLSESS